MRAANNRAAVSVSSDDDISLKPPQWWRAHWHDPNYQRLFIENFIYIRIGDPKDPAGQELCLLKLNDVQADYHGQVTRRDVILKARQQGFSTYILARKFSKAILFSGTNVRIVPHEKDTDDEFRNRLDVMFENLPDHLRPNTKYYSKGEIQFHDARKGVLNSSIKIVVPSQVTKSQKGRGLTLTDLHLTEIPFWKGDQRKTLTALLAAAQHGEITVESTASGIEWFYKVYNQGKENTGQWNSHFYEWWWTREYRVTGAKFAEGRKKEWILLMPGETLKDVWIVPSETIDEEQRAAKRNKFDKAKLTEDEFELTKKILAHLKTRRYVKKKAVWSCDEVAEYVAWRRRKIKDESSEEDFKVEYPSNDVDCFENTGRAVVSAKYLKVTCRPLNEGMPGHRYVIAADTSLGRQGGDPAAIEVVDIDTGLQAHSEELLISPDLLAFRLAELSDRFNWAMLAVERNNTGIATLRKLNELVEDERIYKELTMAAQRAINQGSKTYDEALAEAEFGIATTTANKSVMGVYLEEAIRNGYIGLSSEEFCTQARTVVWISSNQWEALPGQHDDRFVALAIANYVRVQVMTQTVGFVGVMPETGYAR